MTTCVESRVGTLCSVSPEQCFLKSCMLLFRICPFVLLTITVHHKKIWLTLMWLHFHTKDRPTHCTASAVSSWNYILLSHNWLLQWAESFWGLLSLLCWRTCTYFTLFSGAEWYSSYSKGSNALLNGVEKRDCALQCHSLNAKPAPSPLQARSLEEGVSGNRSAGTDSLLPVQFK